MRLLLSAALFLTFFIVGCGGSSSSSGPTLVEINIEPKIAILDIGTSELYQAFSVDTQGNVADVTSQVSWSLENDSGIVEISDNPEHPGYAVATAVAAGKDNIVATLGGFSTNSSLTTVEAQLISLDVSPNEADLPTGGEETFSAVGTYDDGHTQDLTDESSWTIANPSIASISEAGVLNAKSEGSTALTAAIDTLSDTANVIVRDPVEIESISVSPQDAELIVDSLQLFNAYAHYTDGSTQTITNSALWTSSDTAVADQDLNSRNGVFLAKSEGVAEITAELGINNKGTTTLVVNKFVITEILVSPKDFTLHTGETKRYFTKAVDSTGRLYSVNQSENQSYRVEDPDIAYISNTPENKGQLTALKPGSTVVHTTFEYEELTYTDETTVTIMQ